MTIIKKKQLRFMISPLESCFLWFFFLPFWGVSVKVSVLANISEDGRILPLHF